MNYKISFQEMNRLAAEVFSKERKFTLEEMREQVQNIKCRSQSKVKKKSCCENSVKKTD
ncbi:hypothetical protein ACF3N7_00250 [Cruoricaptor ignavus]|uniref:hypothetical protein n=1 Tax=Cruoricaptor ignavus TaxID=1118202 RepID=UPI00370D34B8